MEITSPLLSVGIYEEAWTLESERGWIGKVGKVGRGGGGKDGKVGRGGGGKDGEVGGGGGMVGGRRLESLERYKKGGLGRLGGYGKKLKKLKGMEESLRVWSDMRGGLESLEEMEVGWRG